MEQRRLYNKKLCMSELEVEHTSFDRSHYFEAAEGRASASFLYIVRGSVNINTMGHHLIADAGSLLYIPEGERYSAVWQDTEEIEYYAFHVISKKYDLTNNERYEIQRIAPFSTPQTGELFGTVFRLVATEERIAKVRAIGIYYSFYADVLPHLRASSPVKDHPALAAAMAYIEEHYAEDYDVDVLAAAACISESRLYHLFREELNTTPIKFRNEIRVERASRMLRMGNASMDEIAVAHGFHSTVYFREIFKGVTGMTPSAYRNMAKRTGL